MKLAEALIIRSDLQQKLYSLQSRLSKNTTVQEGNEPTEDPNLLLKEILAVHELLHELILKIQINHNVKLLVQKGKMRK